MSWLLPTPPGVDFTRPVGEPALVSPDSVSWRVFKNPIALLTGGVAAVLLELAEPRVRTGVWEHTTFRSDPVRRIRRTGMAAMITVYGARSVAEKMIAGVRSMHERVAGHTPAGVAYRANDPELLDWVHATASFGFLEGYCAFVSPLSARDRDRFYAEGTAAAALYGATGAPRSVAEQRALFDAMTPRLEPSPIVHEFLDIMRRAPVLPAALRPLQELALRGGVAIVPAELRRLLGLDTRLALGRAGAALLRAAGRVSDRVRLPGAEPARACARLGLPAGHLYGGDVQARSGA